MMFFCYFQKSLENKKYSLKFFGLSIFPALVNHTHTNHVIKKSEWTKNSRETSNMPISLTVKKNFLHFCDYCNSNNKKMFFYSNLSMIRIIISTKHDEYEQNRLLCRLNMHIVRYVFSSFLLALWNIFSPTLSLFLFMCACICVSFLLLIKAFDQEHG